MADEQVIIEIKVDTDIKSVEDLNKNIENLKTKQEQLNSDFVDGKKTLAQYNDETKKNSSQLKSNENSLKSLTSAVKIQDGSINALREQNKKLNQERNNLNLSNAEGQKRLKEINKQLDENNEKIKENVSGLEQQKINIGNYSSALDGIVPGFSGFIGGIQGATRASLAFIATPLGAALAAIALALAAFSNYLKTTGEGEDLVAEKTASLNAALKLFSNYLNEIISFLLDADGSFEKLNKRFGALSYTLYLAYKPLQLLITGLTALAKLAPGYEAGKQLAQDLDQASDAAGLLALKQKDVRNEIDLLLLKAQDKKISDEQRAAFLDEALNKEIELNKEITAQKQEDLRLGLEQIKQDNLRAFTSIDTAKKTNEEIANLLLNNGQITDDQRERIQDLLGAIKDNANESIQLQQKILNKENQAAEERKQKLEALREKEKQDAEKRKAEQEKELARLTELQRIEESFAQAERNRISDLNKFKIDSQKSVSENITSIVKANEEGLTKIVEKETKKKIALEEQRVKNEAAKEQQLRNLRDQALSTVASVFQKNKDVQIGLALVSTYLSAQKAFESQFNPVADVTSPIRGAAAAALAVIQGLARVQAIRSVDASGGSASVSASSGRSGVTATQATTNPINQTFSAANAFRNMPPVIASWQEATTVRNRVEFKEALTTV